MSGQQLAHEWIRRLENELAEVKRERDHYKDFIVKVSMFFKVLDDDHVAVNDDVIKQYCIEKGLFKP